MKYETFEYGTMEEIGGRPLGEELHLRDAGAGSLLGRIEDYVILLGFLVGAAVAGVLTVKQLWERKMIMSKRREKEIADNGQMGPCKEEKIELMDV